MSTTDPTAAAGSAKPRPDHPVAAYLPVEGLNVDPGAALLEAAGFEVVRLASPDQLPDLPAETVALLAGYDPVGAESMDRLPALSIIATHSAGFDMVDVSAAKDRGIWVCNLPDGASEEVATHALALTLACLRQLPEWQRRVARGEWVEDQSLTLRRLSELTCGVVGLGRIGSRYAAMAQAIFGRVIGVDPYLAPGIWPPGVDSTDHDTVFRTADVVSLHVPLTPETRGIASAERLAAMPRGAVIVNVSRGALIDEAALVQALDSGHLAAAGLDVLTQEPPEPGHPLLHSLRTIVTPHVGYLSAEAYREYALKPAQNVVTWWEHGRPRTPV